MEAELPAGVKETTVEDELKKEKLKHEIRDLRQKSFLEPIRAVLTFSSISLLVVGIMVEGCRRKEERAFKRKVEIGEQFQELVSRTVGAVEKASSEYFFYKYAMETFRDRLEEFQKEVTPSKGKGSPFLLAAELAQMTDSLKKSLEPRLTELTFWKEGAIVEGVWASKKNQFTPDFPHFFGAELDREWKMVFQSADDLLSTTFNFMEVGGDKKALDSFLEVSGRFQQSINAQLYPK